MTVSGPGLVPYVDPAFRVEAGMAPVEVVVQAPDSAPSAKVASSGILGDVDNTSHVDFFDALLVALHSQDASIVMPNNGDISLGDVNADGQVDLSDAWLIAAYLNDPSDPSLPAGIGESVGPAASLSPDPSTVTFADDGAWHRFTVQTGEPVSVVVNPAGTPRALEITTRSGRGNYCPAEADDGATRRDGQTIYLSGCAAGEATLELRRESDGTVLRTYTFEVTGSPADLVVQSVSVSDSTLTPGQSFTLRATVRNQGTAESAATTLRWYRSSNRTISTRDTEVGTDAVGALGASGSSAESIRLSAPSSAGTYYYGACVTSVGGERAGNNCSRGVRVRVEAESPDLVVESAVVSDSTLTPGQSFTLSATVRNQGTGAAVATALRYYRSTNATISTRDSEVGTDPVDALAASGTSAESINLTAPSGEGTYYYGACVAPVDGEVDPGNNCSPAAALSVSIQDDDALSSPPPTWVFSGDVPEAHKAELREEMEYVRTWFADQYGFEATGFTVLVSANYEALSPTYPGVVGAALSNHYHPQAKFPYAWVTRSATGGAVMALMYGTLSDEPLSTLKHHIAHEYFHVLQGQLASGFAQLPDGEIAWHSDASSRGPNWLVEGLASYADYAYTPSRAGRRPFLGDRYYPYNDLQWFYLNESVTIGDLAELGSYLDFKCTFSDNYSYPLSFAASVFLLEQAQADSYVNYWTLLGERSTWEQAFEEAFGVRVSDFYAAFDEWLPSQLPPLAQLKLQMRWPDMESLPQTWRFLYLNIENWGTWESRKPSNLSTGWTGLRGLPLQMTATYDEGAVGSGYLSLWWSDDQCTAYLLGWYRDGELTSRREDATAVEFTGRSATIDWNIPGHPDTLPRLQERERVPGCK